MSDYIEKPYYNVKVFDAESNSTTTLSRCGTVEEIKESVEEDGWKFVSIVGVQKS